MFKKFYPTVYVESVYSVDFKSLYNKGYRGLLTDVDNTLVPHGAPSNAEAEALFDLLREIGWEVCIISNNDEERVTPFANRVNARYVFKAGKPLKKGYEKGLEIMGTTKENTLFIGDQLFTDIWGANNAGLKSILVKPIKRDYKFLILLKRVGEAIVKKFYFMYAKRHPESL